VAVTVDRRRSVEITHGTSGASARGFKLGVIRLSERFVKSDRSPHHERKMVRHTSKPSSRDS
jgi:hypothetical protein